MRDRLKAIREVAAPLAEEKTAKLCGLIDNLEASADFAADLAECLA